MPETMLATGWESDFAEVVTDDMIDKRRGRALRKLMSSRWLPTS